MPLHNLFNLIVQQTAEKNISWRQNGEWGSYKGPDRNSSQEMIRATQVKVGYALIFMTYFELPGTSEHGVSSKNGFIPGLGS